MITANMIQHKIRLTLIAVFLIMVAIFVMPTRAYALLGDATNQIPNNGSTTPWLIVTRPGTNGMDAPQTTSLMYVPVSMGASVSFTWQNACDTSTQDANSWVTDTALAFNQTQVASITGLSANTSVGSGFGIWWVFCNSGTDSTFTINLNTAALPIATIGGVQYRQLPVVATTTSTPASYYVNRFRYIVPGGVLITYNFAASQPGSSSGYTGIANSDAPNGWGWSTVLTFALPCTAAAQNNRQVYFFDTDHSGRATSSSPFWQSNTNPMTYTIRAYNRQTDALVSTIHNGQWLTTGQNQHEATLPFNIDPAYKYSITVSGINFVNSIQIALPVEPVYANDPCPVSQTWNYVHSAFSASRGGVNATSAGFPAVAPGAVSITSAIRNSGTGSGANYTHNVERSIGGAAWTAVTGSPGGGQSGLGSGGTRSPGGISSSVPTGLTNGTTVCFRATVSPIAGISSPLSITNAGTLPSSTLCFSIANTPPSYTCGGLGINPSANIDVNQTGVTVRPVVIVTAGTGPAPAYSLQFTAAGSVPLYSNTVLPHSISGSSYLPTTPAPISYATPGIKPVSWRLLANGVQVINCPGSITVSARPLVKVFGGDVQAGANFMTTGGCSAVASAQATGNVRLVAGNDYVGSSVQLGIFALNQINGIRSSGQRNPSVSPLTTSFANTSTTSPAGPFGGNFGTAVPCARDYFADMTAANTSILPSTDLSTVASGRYRASGTTTLTTGASGIANARELVIYVDGDVFLSRAGASTLFGYQNTSWGSFAQIPSLYIIARGNIYINNAVTRVDGSLIAQPNGANGGEIFTCSSGTNVLDPAGVSISAANQTYIASSCGSRLDVNGAFIARRVHLLRTNGQLGNAAAPLTSAETATNPAGWTNNAEVFRYTSELFVRRNQYLLPTTVVSPAYDAFSSIAPAL